MRLCEARQGTAAGQDLGRRDAGRLPRPKFIHILRLPKSTHVAGRPENDGSCFSRMLYYYHNSIMLLYLLVYAIVPSLAAAPSVGLGGEIGVWRCPVPSPLSVCYAVYKWMCLYALFFNGKCTGFAVWVHAYEIRGGGVRQSPASSAIALRAPSFQWQ